MDRSSGGIRCGGRTYREHRSSAENVHFERSEDHQDNDKGTFDDHADEGLFSGERSVDEVDLREDRPRRRRKGTEVHDHDDGQGQRFVEEEWLHHHRIDVTDHDDYDDERHGMEADQRGR
jgi:hypothetical protein